MRELDDLTLERARREERPAQEALIRHYERPVFHLLYRLRSASPAEVEDLAQETFLRVLRALPRFEPRGTAALSTWILGIATRLAIDAERRLRVRRRVPLRIWPAPPGDPDALAAARQLGARVAAAIQRLPEEQRAVLILRAYHDLDYREIADILGCEVGTVKSRLGRARAALRRTLGDDARKGGARGGR